MSAVNAQQIRFASRLFVSANSHPVRISRPDLWQKLEQGVDVRTEEAQESLIRRLHLVRLKSDHYMRFRDLLKVANQLSQSFGKEGYFLEELLFVLAQEGYPIESLATQEKLWGEMKHVYIGGQRFINTAVVVENLIVLLVAGRGRTFRQIIDDLKMLGVSPKNLTDLFTLLKRVSYTKNGKYFARGSNARVREIREAKSYSDGSSSEEEPMSKGSTVDIAAVVAEIMGYQDAKIVPVTQESFFDALSEAGVEFPDELNSPIERDRFLRQFGVIEVVGGKLVLFSHVERVFVELVATIPSEGMSKDAFGRAIADKGLKPVVFYGLSALIKQYLTVKDGVYYQRQGAPVVTVVPVQAVTNDVADEQPVSDQMVAESHDVNDAGNSATTPSEGQSQDDNGDPFPTDDCYMVLTREPNPKHGWRISVRTGDIPEVDILQLYHAVLALRNILQSEHCLNFQIIPLDGESLVKFTQGPINVSLPNGRLVVIAW